MQAHILTLHTHNLWVGLKNLKCGHVAYQIKGKEGQTNTLYKANTLTVHTYIEIVQIRLSFIELSTEN